MPQKGVRIAPKEGVPEVGGAAPAKHRINTNLSGSRAICACEGGTRTRVKMWLTKACRRSRAKAGGDRRRVSQTTCYLMLLWSDAGTLAQTKAIGKSSVCTCAQRGQRGSFQLHLRAASEITVSVAVCRRDVWMNRVWVGVSTSCGRSRGGWLGGWVVCAGARPAGEKRVCASDATSRRALDKRSWCALICSTWSCCWSLFILSLAKNRSRVWGSLQVRVMIRVAIEDLNDGETIKNAKVRRSKRRETKW